MKKLTQAEFDKLTRKQKVNYLYNLQLPKLYKIKHYHYSISFNVFRKTIKSSGIDPDAIPKNILHKAFKRLRRTPEVYI